MSHLPFIQPEQHETAMVSRDRPAPSSAFESWLRRDLARQNDDILREPVPPELLRLLEG